MEQEHKLNWKKWLLMIVTITILSFVAILIVAASQLNKQPVPEDVFCTQDALQCPDGSYVGRTGPNCEFAACPSPTSDETADWKTYTNSKYGYSVKYPGEWSIKDKTVEYGSGANPPLDVQMFNDSGADCFSQGCVELLLWNNFDLEKAKRSGADAGMASTATASAEILNGKEITKVIRSYSAFDSEANGWKDTGKQYFIYIPVKDHYLSIRANLALKNTLDTMLSTFKFIE